jgi:hypothetical protein
VGGGRWGRKERVSTSKIQGREETRLGVRVRLSFSLSGGNGTGEERARERERRRRDAAESEKVKRKKKSDGPDLVHKKTNDSQKRRDSEILLYQYIISTGKLYSNLIFIDI